MNRTRMLYAFGAGICSIAAPRPSRAETKRRFVCRARLEREPDHKETRLVEVTCDEGKTVNGIDGDRDYKTNPPTVNGLSCDFTAKSDTDPAKIALRVVATYRTTKVTIVGGLTAIAASTEIIASLAPGQESASTLDVNGTPFTLTVSVKPAG